MCHRLICYVVNAAFQRHPACYYSGRSKKAVGLVLFWVKVFSLVCLVFSAYVHCLTLMVYLYWKQEILR